MTVVTSKELKKDENEQLTLLRDKHTHIFRLLRLDSNEKERASYDCKRVQKREGRETNDVERLWLCYIMAYMPFFLNKCLWKDETVQAISWGIRLSYGAKGTIILQSHWAWSKFKSRLSKVIEINFIPLSFILNIKLRF